MWLVNLWHKTLTTKSSVQNKISRHTHSQMYCNAMFFPRAQSVLLVFHFKVNPIFLCFWECVMMSSSLRIFFLIKVLFFKLLSITFKCLKKKGLVFVLTLWCGPAVLLTELTEDVHLNRNWWALLVVLFLTWQVVASVDSEVDRVC